MPLPFTVRCSDGWGEITDEAAATNPPWTLAKREGVGAFQFSAATYKSGPIPDPSSGLLLSMLRDFARAYDLGEPADMVTENGGLRIAAASFHHGNDFIRVWYASDGRSFAKVTYTCIWGEQHAELPECEQMVRTLRFEDDTQVG